MLTQMERLSRFCYKPAIGMLLVRITTGLIFIHHGWSKTGNVPGVEKMMAGIGLPSYMAYAIMFVEIVGGAMLVLGVLARAAGVATAIAMMVAVGLVTGPHKGILGSELEMLLMMCSLGVAFFGAGEYRLMHLFEHDHKAQSSTSVPAAS